MDKLVKMKLFRLLSESSQVTNDEIRNAYGCFMKQVGTISQSDDTYSEIYRILNNTRVEIVFVETLYRYEQGEKCSEICLFAKSISTC